MRFGKSLTICGLISIMLTGLACAGLGVGQNTVATGSGPKVTLVQPTAGQKLAPGQEVKVQSTSFDPASGIVRVELVIDNQVIWIDANPQPQPDTPYVVAQPWTPQLPGNHVIQVRAYNQANLAGQSDPLMVEVTASAQTIPDTPTVVQPGNALPTATSGGTAPTATFTPIPVPPTQPPICTPPPCRLDQDEVYYCPGDCPGGCGTTCATVTPTPTATPTPGHFAPTGLNPEGRFKDIWQELGGGNSRLGYPTGPEISDRNFARQYFERGLMFWWDTPDGSDYIWAMDSSASSDLQRGTSWHRYDDTWSGGDEYSCDQARSNGDKGPRRGFGQVWCERPELQKRLGNPREGEAGSDGIPPYAHVQFFQGGVMLYNPINAEVFVLFDQGDWQRFDW